MLNYFNINYNKDFKNFSILILGVILANIIPIILQPTLKSLYSPEIFGYFEIYYRFSSILVIFFSLRYEYLIFSSKTNEQITRRLLFVVSLITFNFLLSLLILFFTYQYLIITLDIPIGYSFILWLIPLSAYLTACFHLLVFYRTKKSNFFNIAYSRFARRLSEGLSQVILGLNNFVGFGLFAGEIFGNFIALLKLKKNRSKLKRKKTIKFNVSYYKKLFIKNFKFPVNKALPDFLSLFSESIIVILILREFGVAYVGYLELSYKILVIPVTVVGAAIAPLILQKASDAINNNLQLFPQLRTIFIGLVLISLSFLFFVMYALEPLFILFFEENWIQSYVFISILVFLVCLQLIISPMGELLILIDKLKVDAFWKYLKILSLCVLLLFEYKNVNSLVQIYTIASGILYLIYFFIIIYYVRNYDLSLKNNV